MDTGYTIFGNTYDQIYHKLLRTVNMSPDKEVIGMNYILNDPTSLGIDNKVRAFNTANAERFFQWIMSGSTDMEAMKSISPRAQMYDREVDGRNPHYGPRILEQINEVVLELEHRPNTRRAVIMILDEGDQAFLLEKRNRNTIEYPCTVSLTYFIRGDELHAHTVMRSNNVTSTICYDNYIFCKLQAYILGMINARMEEGTPYRLGTYHHYMINAHIVPGEVKRTKKILEAKYGLT